MKKLGIHEWKNGAGVKKILVFFSLVIFIGSIDIYCQGNKFRYDNQNSGYYNSQSLQFGYLKWKYKTDGRIYSSPVVNDEIVYFGSSDSFMYAVNAVTSELIWKFKTNGNVSSTPFVNDSAIYFLSMDSNLYCLNRETGEEKWSFQTGGEFRRAEIGIFGTTPSDVSNEDMWDIYLSSPVVIDTLIYFGSSDSSIYALDARDGELEWKYKTGKGVHSSPAYYDGKVYCGSWDSKMYALDAITGSVIWSYQTGIDNSNHTMEGIQSSPAISDGIVYFGSRDGNAYAFYADDGVLVWGKNTFGGSWLPSSAAIDTDNIYLGSSDAKKFYCLDKETGAINYSVSTGSYTFSSPAITNEMAYIGSFDGMIYAIDKQSGKIVWNFQNEQSAAGEGKDPGAGLNTSIYSEMDEWVNNMFSTGSVLSSPVVVNGMLYFGSTDSCMYALSNLSIETEDIDLGTIIQSDEPVLLNFDVTTDTVAFDSITVSVNSASNTVKESITIDPSNFSLEKEETQTVHVTINTKNLFLTLKEIKLYIDYWSHGARTRLNKKIILVIQKPPAYIESSLLGQLENAINCYPNPFLNSTTIVYSVAKASLVKIKMYNLAGEEMANLSEAVKPAGIYQFYYHSELPAGIYFLELNAGENINIKKVIKIP